MNGKRKQTTREIKRKEERENGGNVALHPMNAILFLLQREYVRECKVTKTVENEEGVLIDEVEHPDGLDFGQWLNANGLIVKQSSIIMPKQKGIIGKI